MKMQNGIGMVTTKSVAEVCGVRQTERRTTVPKLFLKIIGEAVCSLRSIGTYCDRQGCPTLTADRA